MKLAITDANIFIDLFYVGLVDEFFNLNIELYTSIEVISELEESQQSFLANTKNLTILNVEESEYLDELEDFLSKRLSVADISVFYHARELKTGILTGDNVLRKISIEFGFEVHGILWVLDELIHEEEITFHDAIQKLRQLMNYNRRLPGKDCERMLKKWSSFIQ